MRRVERPVHYDALIVGGGPGGSTAATLLARAGRRVLVLEKDRHPRFHIGESLLPYNQSIFEDLGVWAKLEAAGFIRKYGAQFHLGNGSKRTQFVFREGRLTRQGEALQVERARFDHLLLEHAQANGAEVRQGWTVTRFESDDAGVRATARDASGAAHTFRGAFLIDASGRGNFTGNQEGLRVIHPGWRKLALFGHFSGVKVDPGERGGDTVIVRLANKWFWLIPLAADKVSVGCVMDQDEFARARAPADKLFWRIVQSSAPLRERMAHARLASEMMTTTDFSYYNRRLVGRRLLRVGDAAGFLDPIFSAGVYLAMNSARLAAGAVEESLAAGDDGAARLRAYEHKVWKGIRLYWRLVRHFYTTPFMEVFLEPRPKWDLAAAVNAVLAGETEGGWALWWRLETFFLLVRAQRFCAILPRISFE